MLAGRRRRAGTRLGVQSGGHAGARLGLRPGAWRGARPGGRGRAHRRRRRADRGYTVVEVIVAVGVIGVLMTGMAVYFVFSGSVTSYQGQVQVAAQLASDAMERVRAVRSGRLVTGRDEASVRSQYAIRPPAVADRLHESTTELVWDSGAVAGAGASAALPTSPRSVTVAGVQYTQHWYLGRCWRLGDTGGCDVANKTAPGSLEFLRVVTASSWRSRECAGGTCAFATSTLVSPARAEPMFVYPIPAAVWVNRTTDGVNPAALWIATSDLVISGLVHSNADLLIDGSDMVVGPRIEYGTRYTLDLWDARLPTPVRVPPSTPEVRDIAAYRPGGSAAVAAGTGYWTPPASACSSGTYAMNSAPPVGTTIIYVPCALNLNVNTTALVVAEGVITISRSRIYVGDPGNPKATGIISASNAARAVVVSGADGRIYGNIQAVNGGVALLGSWAIYQCGVMAHTVEIRGSDTTIRTDYTCG
ncbi:MAG TPA: prepilin-type N-terminal cleavage/methylation domain-containing protein [Pilimelia sp.]|nr:prepilin-type N-terminal cleavage/methylation domain-containing protein [Pilimelia sp.]